MRVLVGTSGWDYRDWRGVFYPEGLKGKERLRYYAVVLDGTEVNSTFYRVVRRKTVLGWVDQVASFPFFFVCKLHQQFTHRWRLVLPSEEGESFWRRWWEGVSVLAECGRLKGILVQLPPSLRFDSGKVREFIQFIRSCGYGGRLFIEARHGSWMVAEVIEKLWMWDVEWVVSHSSRWGHYFPDVGSFGRSVLYLRFHGPRELFRSSYGEGLLRGWVARCLALGVEEVLAVFNNTFRGRAVEDALAFRRLALAYGENC